MRKPEIRTCRHCDLYRQKPFFGNGICIVDQQPKRPDMTCDKEYRASWDKDNRMATYFRPKKIRIGI